MPNRALLAACLIPTLTSGFAPAPDTPGQDPAEVSWADRLVALEDAGWRPKFSTAHELASLPADEGYAILQAAWPGMGTQTRQQFLKGFYYTLPFPLVPRRHARILDVLRLGVSSPPEVQGWAFNFIKPIAFADFANDYQAYLGWHEANRERPVMDVMLEGCRDYVGRLRTARGNDQRTEAALLRDLRNVFHDVAELREAAIDAGLLDVIESWAGASDTDADALRNAFGVLGHFEIDEAWVRRVVLATAMNHASSRIRSAAISALGNTANAWAVDDLLAQAVEVTAAPRIDRSVLWDLARALAEIGDPRVIPTMIAIIDSDNTYDTVYGVGYFGLGRLTGVEYDESHDGAWWRLWWERNRERFGGDVAAMPIPEIAQRRTDDPDRPNAGGGLPAGDFQAGGNARMQYFLIGDTTKTPKDGFRLLLVLPGGAGGADFHPFVERIGENAAPEGYLLAQLIAPRWSEDQFNNVVWPTRGNPWAGAEFATEDFIKAVIDDVKGRHRIDAGAIHTLSWSSGGPAAYAASLAEDLPISGSMVVMSVFKPDQLPALSRAKGHRYYILHSPDDFIAMRFPEAARDQLRANGAVTKLVTYDGGHGWHGDVYGNIRRGLEWLGK